MRQRGFSLIELMVTVAVLAILLAIGLPSFQSSLRSNRLATATNELIASINLARSEAVRNPDGAAMCASSDGATCTGTWDDGWIVWIDRNGDGNPDLTGADPDILLRYVEGQENVEITASTGGMGEKIRFDNRGRSLESRTMNIQPETCPSGSELLRRVSLSLTGQVKTARGACP